MTARKWRRDFTYVGLRGTTEPSHCTGNVGRLYGTGAVVTPIDDWQRNNLRLNYKRLARPEEKYAIAVAFKWGNMKHGRQLGGYAKTVEQGKEMCEELLDKCEREYAAEIEAEQFDKRASRAASRLRTAVGSLARVEKNNRRATR